MLEPAEVKRWERMTAAMLRHAADDDPEAFAQVVKVLEDARGQLPATCQRLMGGPIPHGRSFRRLYSWADIGAALGVSRQAAMKRFGA